MSDPEIENYKMCRLCATYHAIDVEIFSDYEEKIKIVDIIITCLPFEVSEDDLYPKSLCIRCFDNLDIFYDFYMNCNAATAKLETLIKRANGKRHPEIENYKMCRLCATYAIDVEIFSDCGEKLRIVDKIITCLPFEVSEDDLYPKSLCIRCFDNLNISYDFYINCIAAKAKLETRLKRANEKTSRDKVESIANVGKENEGTIVLSDDEHQPNPAEFLEGESSLPHHSFVKKQDDECGSFGCKTCGRLFSSRSSLTIHAKCNKSFNTKNLLYKHMRSSHIMNKCELCQEKKSSKTDLYNHVKAEHGDNPNVKCAVGGCTQIMRCKADLDRHVKNHRQHFQLHICVFCAELVTSKYKLKQHFKMVHNKDSKFTCFRCVTPFDSFEVLRSHIVSSHSSALERPNTCPVCAKPNLNKGKMIEHIRYHGPTFHPCRICLKILPSLSDLESHFNNHPTDSGDEED